MEMEAQADAETFNWSKQWYPAAVVHELESKVPNAFQLMGKDLVIWKDNQGTWRCFQDCCPHRLAPLSDGRIDESGALFCNYHGWKFDGDGTCTNIPQLPKNSSGTDIKRSCALSYPTKEVGGLLWVWADSSPTRWIDAEASPPRTLAPELEEHGEAALLRNPVLFNKGSYLGRWYRRDFPVSYLAAKENSFNDPSHDTVLHHGVSSLDRKYAAPIEVTEANLTPEGYTVVRSSRQGAGSDTPVNRSSDTSAFPAATRREFPAGSRIGRMSAVAYTTPLGLGSCRQILGIIKDPTTELPPAHTWKEWLTRLLPPQPLWLEHMVLHDVVDADLSMWYGQDVNRAKRVMKEYMPAAADSAPRLMMKWMQKYGGGGPPCSTYDRPTSPEAPMQLARHDLLNRWSQHTSSCSSCLAAYNNIQSAAAVAQVVALAAVAAAAASLAVAGVTGPGLLLAAVAAGLGWVRVQLKALAQRFVFVDYGKHHPSKGP